jgi:predicted nucleotidyltransferase
MRANHQTVLDRFVAACRADERVVAAFLGGSYARGAADEFSDLDLYLITTDEAFKEFNAAGAGFIQQLGEPVFRENFDIPGTLFFVFADGTEGELGFGRASDFTRLHSGPYLILVDKQNILAGAEFRGAEPALDEQRERLRRTISGFWHDLSHFCTALGRGQLWWAHGQLDELRHICVKLARFKSNFFDDEADEEAYFKVEKAVSEEQLAPLQTTFCPLEREAMLQAAFAILRYYQEIAPRLAQEHGIVYSTRLEEIMVERLERLRGL